MLRSATRVQGYTLEALDGRFGSVQDFFFDDRTWTIRYLVAETGTFLPGRVVLLSPEALGSPEWSTSLFPVRLTKKQIQNSPGIDKDRPVSLQKEWELRQYYQWPAYWAELGLPYAAPGVGVVPSTLMSYQQASEPGNPHLRSMAEVMGYAVHAQDGPAGKTTDFIMDDRTWKIQSVAVHTGSWFLGRTVLIPSQEICRIDWAKEEVHTDLTRERLEHSPEYDPHVPINVEYESRLYDYYGRPR